MAAKHDHVDLEPYVTERREVEVFRVPDSDKVSLWLHDGWLSTTTQMKPAEAKELAQLLFGVVAEIEGEDDG